MARYRKERERATIERGEVDSYLTPETRVLITILGWILAILMVITALVNDYRHPEVLHEEPSKFLQSLSAPGTYGPDDYVLHDYLTDIFIISSRSSDF